MSPNHHNQLDDLVEEERAGWEELESLVQTISPAQAEIPGYVPGWSVKDFLAHLAGWLSAAGRTLEQIESGTYTPEDVDADARNEGYVEANREQPLPLVLFELQATRRRLLRYLHALNKIPDAAESALRKAGPEHYAEHLPRLREWVAELRSDPPPGREGH